MYHTWWWYTIPKPKHPHNLTNLRLTGLETGDRRENKSLLAKSKTTVFISDHCPTKQAVRNAFRWRCPRDLLSCVFTDSRLNWSEFTRITPNCDSQAIRPISTKFFYTTPIKTSVLRKPKPDLSNCRPVT
jgi:hypothetical protein